MNLTTTKASESGVHIHYGDGADGASPALDAAWLRQLCLDAGADDAGFVEVERASLAGEHPHIMRAFPRTRTLISIVLRMNRDNVRSPARSVANSEFHHTGDEVNIVIRKIVTTLERKGIRVMNPPMAFPMEADRWMTERMWLVSHKPVAVAAGLGRMGVVTGDDPGKIPATGLTKFCFLGTPESPSVLAALELSCILVALELSCILVAPESSRSLDICCLAYALAGSSSKALVKS